MKRLAFLATGLLAGATLTGLATAAPAPPPVCQLIKDAKGDAKYNNVPGDGSVDITSADVASDGKTVTAVVRVDKLTVPNPQSPLGQAWFLKFNVKGAPEILFLSARQYPQGNAFVYGYTAEDPNTGINTSYTLGTATGALDTAKNEIRISVPAEKFKDAKAKLTKGTKLTGLLADSWRIAGQGAVPSQNVGGVARVPLGGFLLPFDTAEGKTYTVGTRSCVVLGK